MIPSVESSEVVFNDFVKIRRDKLRLPDQSSYHYYTLVTQGEAVSILALTREGKFVLNEEYRHPTGKMLLGTAGGYISPHEPPIEAGKRELLEETGYAADSYHLLGSFYPYPGISAQKLFCILAKGAYKTAEPVLEPAEIITSILKTPDELDAIIASGIQVDGILCASLYFYGLYGQNGRKGRGIS